MEVLERSFSGLRFLFWHLRFSRPFPSQSGRPLARARQKYPEWAAVESGRSRIFIIDPRCHCTFNPYPIEKMNFNQLLGRGKIILIASNFLFFQATLRAQQQPTLDQAILAMDSLLFQVAFNQCDLDLYRRIISPELEFYDDRTGLNDSIERDIRSFQDKCSQPVKVTRKLVDTEIFPLGDYGAVQHGTHIFLVDDRVVEVAQFTTVWERTAESWVVKRAISFDHRPME